MNKALWVIRVKILASHSSALVSRACCFDLFGHKIAKSSRSVNDFQNLSNFHFWLCLLDALNRGRQQNPRRFGLRPDKRLTVGVRASPHRFRAAKHLFRYPEQFVCVDRAAPSPMFRRLFDHIIGFLLAKKVWSKQPGKPFRASCQFLSMGNSIPTDCPKMGYQVNPVIVNVRASWR